MNSLYYQIYNNNNLWVKGSKDHALDHTNIIDKQKLKVKSQFNDSLVYKEFILCKSELILMKKEAIKGIVNLNYIGVDYIKKELKITLFTSMKFFNVYFDELEIFKKWKKILTQKCVLNNFHKKFEISLKIGEGNNTVVYLAKKIKNQKEYAVKVISKQSLDEENGLKSFMNEINVLKILNHDNIVKMHYLFESKNSFYIIMEYCNCKSLNYYIKNEFKNKEKITLVTQILKALSYIHSLNLVHRDLKPDNIFLHKNENNELIAKIGDFGLSNYLNEEFFFKRCGTPGYISPEILNYKKTMEYKISSQVDVYSIGHIIYNLFTNQYIFEFKTVDELLIKNKNNKFKIKKMEDKKMNDLIKNCLETDPSKRIKINELTNYFEKLLN